MDRFDDGHHVRLRSCVLGTYLHANRDEEGVSLRRRRASLKAAWAVHIYLGDDDRPYVLLHSAAYGRYLAATDVLAPRGCPGLRVAQRAYDQPQAESIRWQPFRMGYGDDIVLRQVGADRNRYLRANRRYFRRNNSVSVVNWENVISTMMHWAVEPIPARQGMPRLPGPIRVRLFTEEGMRQIRFVRASDDGVFTEEGWSTFQFRGRSVHHLRNELATRVGVSDLIMCIRAGPDARLTPLVVNLPRDGQTIEIVVIIGGTPASAELQHPDVMRRRERSEREY
ncbi:unnamed protein product [Alopecurus aequalis]